MYHVSVFVPCAAALQQSRDVVTHATAQPTPLCSAQCLLDTGATISFVSKAFVDTFNLNMEDAAAVKVTLATGEELCTT